MAPADIHQVYVTAHFGYLTPWAGEIAQCGWRMGMVPKGAEPAFGQTFTPSNPNSATYTSRIGSDATWTWSQTFLADYGADQWDEVTSLAVATEVLAYWNAVKATCSSVVRLEGVKIALINKDGSYAFPSAEFALVTPQAGGVAGTAQAPPELSVCTSLRAPVLGRRGRGRWYLPSPGQSSSNNDMGKVAAAYRTALVNAGKAYVTALDAIGAANVDFVPIVGIASATTATMIRPAEVRVGDHFDVQRRRQHQVEEVYTSVGL